MQTLKQSDLVFNALGDMTRRSIFEKLQSGPLSVVHIADGLTVSRPAVSQHLKVLKQAKLINVTRLGTRNMCEINQQGIAEMTKYLNQFWDKALSAFKTLAEQEEKIK